VPGASKTAAVTGGFFVDRFLTIPVKPSSPRADKQFVLRLAFTLSVAAFAAAFAAFFGSR
jgi:hypothetical protein